MNIQIKMQAQQPLKHKYIDLDKTIKEQEGGILKKLPRFVINIIKRIIHQEEANRIFNKISCYHGVEFLENMLSEMDIEVDILGLENLPENKKCFFACNHPYGFADALIINKIIAEKYGSVKVIANDVFLFLPQLHEYIAPVNVFDGATKDNLRTLDLLYSQEIPVVHFPAGIVSRKIKGKVEDYKWQKSFVKKAIEHERDIVPIFFHGQNSSLFYTIFLIRSFLGIKANIELMLLPDEFARKKHTTIKVSIGKAISYKQLDKSRTHNDWAQWVRSKAYELGNRPKA